MNVFEVDLELWLTRLCQSYLEPELSVVLVVQFAEVLVEVQQIVLAHIVAVVASQELKPEKKSRAEAVEPEDQPFSLAVEHKQLAVEGIFERAVVVAELPFSFAASRLDLVCNSFELVVEPGGIEPFDIVERSAAYEYTVGSKDSNKTVVEDIDLLADTSSAAASHVG